jgi:beta-glucosidase
MATASGTAVFSEGINSAYRWYLSTNTSVLFPFGYGLSYTSFKYSNLDIKKNSGSTFQVSVRITNTGSRPGVEIPQVYIGPPEDAGSKYPGYQFAISTLVGFDDVLISSGATKTASFLISERQLSFWRQSDRRWVLARGKRSVWVGTDAEKRVLVGHIEV